MPELPRKRGLVDELKASFGHNSIPSRTTPQAANEYEQSFLTTIAPSGAGKAPWDDKRHNIYYSPEIFKMGKGADWTRMIYDLSIFAPLQELLFGMCSLPFSVEARNPDNPREKYAADYIKDILSEWSEFQDFLYNTAWAIYYGRSGSVIDYDWDFSIGARRMIPKGFFSVPFEGLLFDSFGFAGVLSGPFSNEETSDRHFSCVEGWGLRVPEEERDAWVVHSNYKLAGQWDNYITGGRRWGQGLIEFLYPTFIAKNELLGHIYDYIDSFGGLGRLIYYFQLGNQQSFNTMMDASQRNKDSYTLLVPRQSPDSAEGVEVIQPPSGLMDLLAIIDKFERWNRLAICGQELTAESHNSGLGSNTSHVHQSTFARLLSFYSTKLAGTLTQQLVRVLQKFNGFSDIPPLRFTFSTDLKDSDAKIEAALKLFQMGITVEKNELIQASGFSVPEMDLESTDPQQAEDDENDKQEESSTGD